MAAILTNGALKIRTAPIFQPLLARRATRALGAQRLAMYPRQCRARSAAAVASTGFATQRQTAKLTLSQLINRLLPQRTPVRHRRSNRRRLVRPNNQITRALAPPSLPRPPSPTPHDLTPKLRATRPSFVTRYRAGETAIT